MLAKILIFYSFFNQGFLSRSLTNNKAVGEGIGPSLFLSTTPSYSETLNKVLAVMYLRCLSREICLRCLVEISILLNVDGILLVDFVVDFTDFSQINRGFEVSATIFLIVMLILDLANY